MSLAIVIYRIFATLLNVENSGGLIESLDQPLAVLIVALAVLAYHALLIRADTGDAPNSNNESVMTLEIVVSGPSGTDPAAVIASIEAHLPAGFTVRAVPQDD